MATQIIDQRRIRSLNDKAPRDGRYTLYWMQQSQRAEHNDALEFAVRRANENQSRLLVAFALTDQYPDANARHYQFMLQGLNEVRSQLKRRNIKFVLRLGEPTSTIVELARDACEVVCDRGYLRHQRQWRDEVAKAVDCRVWQVEADAIVPVEVASDKQEYAARTIRSQLNELADEFTTELRTTALTKDSLSLSVAGEEWDDAASLTRRLSIDHSVEPVDEFIGGTSHARRRLNDFLSNDLSRYANRTSIVDPAVSHLSPYLHFGQISPVDLALAVKSKRGQTRDSKDAFLEELLVRRELAFNFVHYCADYDSLHCLPDWARETLQKHESDERPHHYTATELENAETHDEPWNAMMTEMKHRGYLHNHLRMYWGKKIIEWTNTIDHAYRTALELNNRYFLDGRDCNSYANIAWLFGLHDRAHAERDVFGKVRFMSADGLKRKIDVEALVQM